MRLVVSQAAETDLVDIQLYGILAFGQKASEDYANGLKKALRRLLEFPQLGPDRPGLNPSVRVLVHRSHIIVYAIDDDLIRILRFRHSSEDWYDNPAG